MPAHSPIDAADCQDLRDGLPAALNRLVARWQNPLREFAYQYLRNFGDAQDLTAETFVRLYRHRVRLRADTNISAWLFTTLTHLCANQYRWRQRHPTLSLDSVGDAREIEAAGSGPAAGGEDSTAELPDPAGLSPDRVLEANEALATLDAAIDALPHDLKTALLLHHYNQLSYQEIGLVVQCSERGVETRIYRAKQRLRSALAGYLGEVSDLGPALPRRAWAGCGVTPGRGTP